jgi:hypothetical protein
MDKIRKIHEWEGCSESSAAFKRVAAQMDSEFKRQRFYMSSSEREQDEVSGVDDTCESDEDAREGSEAMRETDEDDDDDEYETAEDEDESIDDEDESGDDEDESVEDTRDSVARVEKLYPSEEDTCMDYTESTNHNPGNIYEPVGPCEDASQ